jgi:hypothetical protein
MTDFFEILKYILPSTIVFLAVYFVVNRFIEKEQNARLVDLRMNNQKLITPLRLQAYERMALFIERISLTNLVMRVQRSGITSRELQSELLSTIRSEFEHNLSQQIYMSNKLWKAIKDSKEDTIRMINMTSMKVHEDENSIELAKLLLELVSRTDKLPTDVALEMLKLEVKQSF